MSKLKSKFMPVKDYAELRKISIDAVYKGIASKLYKGYKLGSYQLVWCDVEKYDLNKEETKKQ